MSSYYTDMFFVQFYFYYTEHVWQRNARILHTHTQLYANDKKVDLTGLRARLDNTESVDCMIHRTLQRTSVII